MRHIFTLFLTVSIFWIIAADQVCMASDTDVGHITCITQVQPADGAMVCAPPQIVAINPSVEEWPYLEFVQPSYTAPVNSRVSNAAPIERCHGPPNLHRLSLSKLCRGMTL